MNAGWGMRAIGQFKIYLSLLRVKHYIKNAYIFIPSFLDGKFFTLSTFNLILTFLGFSLIVSSTYIINDILDRKKDQTHPIKKYRPIPSGKVSLIKAIVVALILLLLGIIIFYNLSFSLLVLASSYFLMMTLYSIYLKHIIILDVFIIAVGFVMRLFMGSIAASVEVSHWIVLMILICSVFLAVAKRRDDMVAYEVNKRKHRDVILKYSLPLLDSFLIITATLTIILYIMYTVSLEAIEICGTKYLYFTTAFIFFSIFRYLKITLINNDSGDPVELLLKDKIIIVSLLSCGVVFSFLIYSNQIESILRQTLLVFK